jgi:hypothetical protein
MASNDDMIRSTLNDFYSRIGLQKQAADETNAAGGGMEDLKKKKSGDEHQEIDGNNIGAAMKDRGAEVNADLKNKETGATRGKAVLAASDAAQVKDGDGYEHPQEDEQAPKSGGTDDKAKNKTDGMTVTQNTVNQASANEIAKVARAARLGDTILNIIASSKFEQEGVQKVASSPFESEEELQAYFDWKAGFQRGIQKKAEDVQAVLESGATPSADEADALLNAAAAQDPGAVLPEEAQPEAAVGGADAAALDQMAEQLSSEGVSQEEFVAAAKAVDELTQAGYTPDEIIDEASAALAETEAAEEGVQKAASEQRRSDLQGFIGSFGLTR